MTALFTSPPVFDLPLTKGDDLSVRFVYKAPVLDNDGQPVLVNGKRQYVIADYPEGATVALEVDLRPTPLVCDAGVEGHDAVIHESYSVVDNIPKGVAWRVKITFADGLTKVAAYGKTVRND